MDTTTLQIIVFGSIVLAVSIIVAVLAAREDTPRDTECRTLL